jgi:hypothetical protein
MFIVNKEMRNYLRKNYISIKNGFINEGLVGYFDFKCHFIDYLYLEKIYFLAL